ncbi:amino acid ABC transporter substrate-binding protein [Nocardioides marmoriginsengisoli]|uniref:Amino acid ABC transporter substrate-binding protein n=1 Tax=Nocardioides marmoriginsengisoli TaxID=661483 RepID=A0A3N0CBL0_9ACTN|nr:ABC transporter substrate-binding protein [Nocardioides marmoriginsengisoli]RNL60641.1 amino acid ABC transporter substrate-binding protein [Nocardioides marmoriginsengisoli]
MRLHPAALVAVPLMLAVATGCGSVKEEPSAGKPSTCDVSELPLTTAGKLTIGTDSPAYDPWFAKNDPTNGEGFESAVAYAVAEEMGFDKADVVWTKIPFNNSYAPGPKKFDFDINQISITPARQKAVDFSEGYYSAAQAVIVLDKDKVAATSLADLKNLKLGAQTGTTSLTAVRDEIKPTSDPVVFKDTNVAKQALLNGQVDAIVADLPTAFYITAAEIEGSSILGQFQPTTGTQEEFGLLLAKGSELTGCVDKALGTLKDNGELAGIEKQWLSETVNVPVLK